MSTDSKPKKAFTPATAESPAPAKGPRPLTRAYVVERDGSGHRVRVILVDETDAIEETRSETSGFRQTVGKLTRLCEQARDRG